MSEPSIKVRNADQQDAKDVWLWRNDSHTREMFKQSALVDWQAHQTWFVNALARTDLALLIGCIDGSKIGVVRFDLQPALDPASTPNANSILSAEVSINLNPAMRGRGLSVPLLRQSIVQGQRLLGFNQLVAEIKTHNDASNQLFTRLGFHLQSTGLTINQYLLNCDLPT